MSIHITQIGKHRFICGLFWQSLSRPRELVKEAAELAKKIDSDLMVVRKGNATAQAGFAHTRDGARRMAYSLGAVVSKTLELEGVNYDGQKQATHNWLGAFKLPDGLWAYFAVRDSSFLPNGDFAGTKDEVLDRLHGDYGLGGWNAVIGDAELEEYGFHNFNVRRIEDLIPHGKNGHIKAQKSWGLRPVETKIPWPLIVAGSLSIMLAVGGYAYWQWHQRKQEEQQRELALEAARQKMFGKAELAALPHPWPSTPLPLLTVKACLDNLNYLTVGGWSLDDYTCTTNGVINYTWSRNDSTVNFLLEQVPGADIDLTGNKATLAVPLRLPSGSDEKLLDRKAILEPLVAQLQLMNISPRIALIPPLPSAQPQATLPGATPQDVPLPDWQQFSLAVNTGSMPPTEIATILSQPGIRLSKLSYRSGAWSIEGVIYAKLP